MAKANTSEPVPRKKSSRVAKPKTDPDLLYDVALPAWTPDKVELSTTPKRAELFSEKQQLKVELKSRDMKSKGNRKSNETGEMSKWLALKWETLVLELRPTRKAETRTAEGQTGKPEF